ncbi:MAG: hypothetical protein BWX88_04625 [Planctomycetes bacterium ADurb.Bin126]|nr:MAG: hypothetical protein BWX88_04625 [Planctomycetes bacterium ADurb.Bin126]
MGDGGRAPVVGALLRRAGGLRHRRQGAGPDARRGMGPVQPPPRRGAPAVPAAPPPGDRPDRAGQSRVGGRPPGRPRGGTRQRQGLAGLAEGTGQVPEGRGLVPRGVRPHHRPDPAAQRRERPLQAADADRRRERRDDRPGRRGASLPGQPPGLLGKARRVRLAGLGVPQRRPARGQQRGRRVPGHLRHGPDDPDHVAGGRAPGRAGRPVPPRIRQGGARRQRRADRGEQPGRRAQHRLRRVRPGVLLLRHRELDRRRASDRLASMGVVRLSGRPGRRAGGGLAGRFDRLAASAPVAGAAKPRLGLPGAGVVAGDGAAGGRHGRQEPVLPRLLPRAPA